VLSYGRGTCCKIPMQAVILLFIESWNWITSLIRFWCGKSVGLWELIFLFIKWSENPQFGQLVWFSICNFFFVNLCSPIFFLYRPVPSSMYLLFSICYTELILLLCLSPGTGQPQSWGPKEAACRQRGDNHQDTWPSESSQCRQKMTWLCTLYSHLLPNQALSMSHAGMIMSGLY
jgi:hypothetical protein